MTTQSDPRLKVLEVSSSGRHSDSVTRMLTQEIIAELESREGDIKVTRRDLSDGVDLVDQAWINANFTHGDDRTAAQKSRLAESDTLVAELQQTDVVIIGAPIYNFGVPASLKAWVDMIARARLTFRYTDNGPQGLLQNKKAFVVVASGGVAVDSPVDFATPYLRHALAFVGITDVEIIAADELNKNAGDGLDRARSQIAQTIHTNRDYRVA